jgi:Bacterial Ig-like domain
MNQQMNVSEVQSAALEIKGGTTMNKIIRNSLSITAFTALALVFGACSQPTPVDLNTQTNPAREITDIFAETGPDVLATDADLAEIEALEATDLKADGIVVPDTARDTIAPTVVQFYPRDKSEYDFSTTACPSIGFSETMNHNSIKAAFKIVVKPPNGAKAFVPRGTFRWFKDTSYSGGSGQVDTVEFCPNVRLKNLSWVQWGVTRDVKDLAGNKLRTARKWSYRAYD